MQLSTVQSMLSRTETDIATQTTALAVLQAQQTAEAADVVRIRAQQDTRAAEVQAQIDAAQARLAQLQSDKAELDKAISDATVPVQ